MNILQINNLFTFKKYTLQPQSQYKSTVCKEKNMQPSVFIRSKCKNGTVSALRKDFISEVRVCM